MSNVARRSRRRWFECAGAFALAAGFSGGACNRTPAPDEQFLPVGAGARAGQGGRAGVGGVREPALGGAETRGGREASGGSSEGGRSGDAGAGNVGEGGAATTGGASSAGSGNDGGTSSGLDCGEPPVTLGAFTREALRSAAAECALYQYCRFESAALELQSAVHAHADAPDAATLAESERAYARALGAWSRVELFQFGPLASKSESAGKDVYQGQGFRDLVYSWPTTARCRVEEQVASQSFQKGMGSVLISARGLFGLEYSLFYPGTDTACTPISAAGKLWPTLSEGALAARKRSYAVALADDVVAQVQAATRAWQPDGGNFKPSFVSASAYPSDQEAMNVLGFALIYVEREVKDWKLGIPAGYTLTHPVSGPESPFLGLETATIRENLRGFRALFEGCGANGEGIGFDDWLTEVGHGELAADIVGAWRNAQAVAEASPPLHLASAQELETLYRAVKALTDLLKTDLFGSGSPLNLKLPAGVEGDTD